jgi:hypothetical protein
MLTRRMAQMRDGVWTLGPRSVGCSLLDMTCGPAGSSEFPRLTRGPPQSVHRRACAMLGSSTPALWRLSFRLADFKDVKLDFLA